MRRLSWHLSELMALRGISSASELSRRLTAAGHGVTPTHAARFVKAMPTLFPATLLEALLQVLDCSVAELLGGAPSSVPAKQAAAEASPAPLAADDGQEEQILRKDVAPASPLAEPEAVPAVTVGAGDTQKTTVEAPLDSLKPSDGPYLPPTPLF